MHRHWKAGDLAAARVRRPGQVVPTARLTPDPAHEDHVLPVRRSSLRSDRIDYTSRLNCFLVTFNTWRAYPWLRRSARAQTLLDVLCVLQRRRGFELPRFTIMADHWHGLIRPSGNGESLWELMRDIKVSFLERRKRQGDGHRFWQRGFDDELLRTEEAVHRADAYIVWNAVKAGYVARPEDYAWCGAVQSGRFIPLRAEKVRVPEPPVPGGSPAAVPAPRPGTKRKPESSAG